ncbi:MAG TPA: ribosome biogenesis factor YjgA [Methylibium sp.]
MTLRDADPADERPSKTQLKKTMHELQELGEALLTLPDERLERIPMPDTLREAVQALKRTRSHEGRRRQLQYVGKLMRGADVAPIREAVAAFRLGGAQATLALHQAERWRSELIADDAALTRWMDAYPQTDVQALRSLIRAARKDAPTGSAEPSAGERKGRAYREIFQFIRQQLDANEPGAAHE